jgi:hypothetical protein
MLPAISPVAGNDMSEGYGQGKRRGDREGEEMNMLQARNVASKRGPRSVMKVTCLIALLCFGRVAIAQITRRAMREAAAAASASVVPSTAKAPVAGSPATAPAAVPSAPAAAPSAPEKTPAVSHGVSYQDGLLSIQALDSKLSDLLAKVAALTGVNIDVPPGSDGERMPVVDLGPGPPRQVLASLLSDWNFDYMIQASDSDPNKLKSVLLIPRDKKDSAAAEDAAARTPRSPFARPLTQSEKPEAPASDPPVTAQVDLQPAAAAAPAPPLPEPPPPVPPEVPMRQDQPWNIPKVSPLPVPSTLNSQSINNQLQQMYQQRIQQIQQASPVVTPATPIVK